MPLWPIGETFDLVCTAYKTWSIKVSLRILTLLFIAQTWCASSKRGECRRRLRSLDHNLGVQRLLLLECFMLTIISTDTCHVLCSASARPWEGIALLSSWIASLGIQTSQDKPTFDSHFPSDDFLLPPSARCSQFLGIIPTPG
jgi:hypothetical protein